MPYRTRWRHRGPSPPDYRVLPPLETVRGATYLQSTICDVPLDGPENRNEHGAEQSPATACHIGGRSRRSYRRLTCAVEHLFQRPYRHPKQPADPDCWDFATGGGVISRIPAQSEVLFPSLGDRDG